MHANQQKAIENFLLSWWGESEHTAQEQSLNSCDKGHCEKVYSESAAIKNYTYLDYSWRKHSLTTQIELRVLSE